MLTNEGSDSTSDDSLSFIGFSLTDSDDDNLQHSGSSAEVLPHSDPMLGDHAAEEVDEDLTSAEDVYFSNCSFNSDEVLELARKLEANSRLRGLGFDNVILTTESVTTLIQAVTNKPLLAYLTFNDMPALDDSCGTALAALLAAEDNHLLGLELSGTSIGDPVAIKIANAIPGNLLRVLILNNTKITNKGAIALVAALCELEKSTALEELNIGNNPHIDSAGVIAIAKYLQKPDSYLEKLCLTGITLDRAAVEQLKLAINRNPNLKCIKLRSPNMLGSKLTLSKPSPQPQRSRWTTALIICSTLLAVTGMAAISLGALSFFGVAAIAASILLPSLASLAVTALVLTCGTILSAILRKRCQPKLIEQTCKQHQVNADLVPAPPVESNITADHVVRAVLGYSAQYQPISRLDEPPQNPQSCWRSFFGCSRST